MACLLPKFIPTAIFVKEGRMTEKPLQLINVSHTKSCPRSVKFFKNGISKLKKYILTPYVFYGVRLQ